MHQKVSKVCSSQSEGLDCYTKSLISGTRLSKRGYTGTKLEDNLSAEIFQTILDEAREAYREEIVIELQSEEEEQTEANVARVEAWMASWLEDRGKVRPGKRRADTEMRMEDRV